MGIDVIRLTGDRNELEPRLEIGDLASPVFQVHHFPSPAMSIWLMSIQPGKTLFPWWKYESQIDDDLHAVNDAWAISSPQQFFDALFLARLQKLAGGHFFAIFPGIIKKEGWGNLRDIDRETFTRGQGCMYHLYCSYEPKLSVNWVPFWEPQSFVRNPSFSSLWRLFAANMGDGVTRAITMFSIPDTRQLPEVVNLLISKDDSRSEKLSSIVDWYGVYSSPLSPRAGTCAMVYSRKKEIVSSFMDFQVQFGQLLEQSQKEMISEPRPKSVIRIMSRQIAL